MEVSPHLNVIFNEARCLHTSLHIETDVHLHLRFLVSQLDDWHLQRGEYYSTQWKLSIFMDGRVKWNQKCRIYCSIIIEISTVEQLKVQMGLLGAFNDRNMQTGAGID